MDPRDWKKAPILVVDDEEDNLDAFRFTFRKSFQLHFAQGGSAALDLLDRLDPAVIVSDQRMPKMSGLEFLARAKARRPDAFAVLLTAYADLSVLVEAINSGAVDRYVSKPWDSKELGLILKQGIFQFETVRENQRLRQKLAEYAGYLEREQRDPIDYGQLVGQSEATVNLRSRIDETADLSGPVLLEGEPGSELEVVARAIHVGSSREHHPFVRVTCSAFTGEGLTRELVGYRRGAFPHANDDRAGRIELSDRGTLYLEFPQTPSPELQTRLLELLRDQTVERLGSTDRHQVDVRLIIAVAPTLAKAWDCSRVLPELLAKLDVLPLKVPPLRERKMDIGRLARHFLTQYGRRNPRAARELSAEAEETLTRYDYPGNTHELENVIERAAILARGDVIHSSHLAFPERPAFVGVTGAPEPPPSPEREGREGLTSKLEEVERRELLSALEKCGGNKAEVARLLGIQRTTLYYRLKRLGIEG